MADSAGSTQRRWCHGRLSVLAFITLVSVTLAPASGSAQEPLFIRIRPLPDAEVARVARALLWARQQAHARAVIESVCTGCLGAWKPEPAVPPSLPSEPAENRIANLTVPIGVELDPASGASEQHSYPSTSERQP